MPIVISTCLGNVNSFSTRGTLRTYITATGLSSCHNVNLCGGLKCVPCGVGSRCGTRG